MSEKKCKKVRMNLLAQDCYIMHGPDPIDTNDYLIDTYTALDTVTKNGAIVDEFHEEKYPITPESVASYAAGCEAEKLASIGAPPRGRNLGDVRILQDILSGNSTREDILQALASALAPAGAPQSDVKTEEVKQSDEVKKDG